MILAVADPLITNAAATVADTAKGNAVAIVTNHSTLETIIGFAALIFIVSVLAAMFLPEDKPNWAKGPFEQ